MEQITHGHIRKEKFSIESIERLLDKASYPTSRNVKRRIVIGNESVRYYNPNYHIFFQKGYSCVKCGLTGQFFALESSGSDGLAYSLCLYAINPDGDEVLMVGSKIDTGLEKTKKHYYDIQPMCFDCNRKTIEEYLAQKTTQMRTPQKKPEIKIDISSLGQMKEIKKPDVFLIDGSPIKNTKVVAYCNNATHWGWLNVRLMQEHSCLEKQCSFLEKANPNYWANIERNRIKKEFERTQKKGKAAKIKERDEYIHTVLKPYKDIYVTSIREEKGCIHIAYIYDKYIDLSDAIQLIRRKYKQPVYMKQIKSSQQITQLLIRDRKTTDLLSIPGVGIVTKKRLNDLGYYFTEDLLRSTPEEIFKKDCDFTGSEVNRRMLHLYRKAVEFANKNTK
ncbi:MAG: helix-hairpin-helix domain-containing protein [Oscillospiraceae bacterium]|nr:helix-hairpin-helix domain-containing protein [Oscillospiraceae bacterium]